MPYRGFIQEAAGPAQRQLSLGLCALVLLSVLVVVPRAAMPLPQLPHISGMYGAATAMIDLATFWLLISAPRPHRSHIVIAAAYLFASLMAILHVLTFPGAVFADGPVLGSPHAVSWLFIGWRAGFAMLIAWAALVEPPDAQASPARPEHLQEGRAQQILGEGDGLLPLASNRVGLVEDVGDARQRGGGRGKPIRTGV